MADVPAADDEEPTVETVTDGYFEEEYHIDAASAGEFLIDLGEQLREGDELTVTGDGWEIPFAFGEPVELEIEFQGHDDPELEIEIELAGRVDDEAPNLE
jgi:amphi-Trp domain-containing protein